MGARFQDFYPNPLPASCIVTARPHHHHHLVRATVPPRHTIPHCCSTRYAWNQATIAQFLISAQPPPCLTFHERTAAPPPPPLPGTCHHATPKHRPPSLFHTAHPKPSHNGLVSNLLPKPLPASHFAIARPHHHHHHLICITPPPLHTIPHRRFTQLGFRYFDPNPSLPLVLRLHDPTTTTTLYTPPPHHYVPTTTPPLPPITPLCCSAYPKLSPVARSQFIFVLLHVSILARYSYDSVPVWIVKIAHNMI